MSQTNQAQGQEPAGGSVNNELILTPNIIDGDDFYDELLHAHSGMSKEDSDAFNARLILVLCNHVGDRNIIRQALKVAARQT